MLTIHFLLACVSLLQAPDQPPPTATLELVLPVGATASADGRAVENPKAVTVHDFKKDEIRRVKVAVTFADGTADERQVDVAAGQRLRVAVPQPGPEKAAVIGSHPLVPINAAAVSADGRHIALGLDARTVVLWDTAAGRPVRSLAGHQKPVLAVAFSPDGQKLISGSADTTVVLWEVETGKQLRTYKGHAGPVVSLAFAPDGKRFLSGSPDGLAIHWEIDTGEQVHKFKGRDILGVAYSPDGNTLATASVNATATLWDATTGRQNFVLRGHREDVNCVAFSPDGKRVATGSSDDTGVVWDVTAGTRITRTARHTNNIHSAAFTPDGRRVITGEREELVIMSDAATGAPARTFVGHSAEIFSIVPSPDGKTMITGSRDGTARVWDLTTGRELLTLTTDGTGKSWAAVSPDGLLDGSEGGRKSLGYRFPKGGFGDVDQFFAEGFRPGLLAEVWRGERPFPAKPLGRSKPPLVKLAPPKGRATSDPTATLTADITDQGGGVGTVVVENNGVRVGVPTRAEPGPKANVTRVTFTVPLAPGANRVGVRAATADGSRESPAAELELSLPTVPGQRGRLYVVAVGVSDAVKEARRIAELLRDRGGKLFDRVDVIPVSDKEATKAAIEDTVKDVAELSRPQDTIVVLLFGRGGTVGQKAYYAPHDVPTADTLPKGCVPVDEIAAVLGTARALNRVLVADTAAFGLEPNGRTEFDLPGTVERWGRAFGVHSLIAIGSPTPTLAKALTNAAGEASDVTDWLRSAADRAAQSGGKVSARRDVYAATKTRGFPILSPGK